jgi:hypothetical protein
MLPILSIFSRLAFVAPLTILAADAASEPMMAGFNPWVSLTNIGAVGAVLIWFMFRAEPRLKAIEKATDRQTRAMILLTLNMPSTSARLQELGKEIVQEIEKDAAL